MRHRRETARRAVDLILDALAVRLTDGYVAAAPLLLRALGIGQDARRERR